MKSNPITVAESKMVYRMVNNWVLECENQLEVDIIKLILNFIDCLYIGAMSTHEEHLKDGKRLLREIQKSRKGRK